MILNWGWASCHRGMGAQWCNPLGMATTVSIANAHIVLTGSWFVLSRYSAQRRTQRMRGPTFIICRIDYYFGLVVRGDKLATNFVNCSSPTIRRRLFNLMLWDFFLCSNSFGWAFNCLLSLLLLRILLFLSRCTNVYRFVWLLMYMLLFLLITIVEIGCFFIFDFNHCSLRDLPLFDLFLVMVSCRHIKLDYWSCGPPSNLLLSMLLLL